MAEHLSLVPDSISAFVGTDRFLASPTFLSRWPNVSWLSTSGRNRFITILMTTKKGKKGQSFLHCILWHDAEWQNAVRYAARNWCTSSTHPSQAAVKINKFFQWTSHFSVRETETAQKRDCLKPLSKTHFVTQICTVLPIISAWGLSMRGVYVALKVKTFCLFATESCISFVCFDVIKFKLCFVITCKHYFMHIMLFWAWPFIQGR